MLVPSIKLVPKGILKSGLNLHRKDISSQTVYLTYIVNKKSKVC